MPATEGFPAEGVFRHSRQKAAKRKRKRKRKRTRKSTGQGKSRGQGPRQGGGGPQLRAPQREGVLNRALIEP